MEIGVKQAAVSSFENPSERTRVETPFKLLSAMNLERHAQELKTYVEGLRRRISRRGSHPPVVLAEPPVLVTISQDDGHRENPETAGVPQ